MTRPRCPFRSVVHSIELENWCFPEFLVQAKASLQPKQSIIVGVIQNQNFKYSICKSLVLLIQFYDNINCKSNNSFGFLFGLKLLISSSIKEGHKKQRSPKLMAPGWVLLLALVTGYTCRKLSITSFKKKKN